MMIEIQFNRNIIKRIKSFNFQVDQIGSIMFILFGLYEQKFDLLDEFDDYNKQRRALLLYKEMEIRELLVQNEDAERGTPHFTLSKAGIELVEFIKNEFVKTTHEEINTEKIAVLGVDAKTNSEDPEDWIDEWMNIFPVGLKTGGRLVRGDKPSCIRKLKVFMKEYKYTKDQILAATTAYIKSKEQDNFNFTRCAVYFIYRIDGTKNDRVSDLAAWCEHIQDEGKQDTNTESNIEMMV